MEPYQIQLLISNIIIAIGVFFMIFGVIGIFRFKDFYHRILVAAKVDTVGMITLLLGLVIRHGFSFFSAKMVLMMIIVLILNPLVAHVMVRSAYRSGYKLEGQLKAEKDDEASEDEEDSDWSDPIW
ncbi:MAG: monovalent cation/H(+) antiporter subunit G [Defluviitaleaceae bacterium]|nr:monovalent cation/H(+) antiporter subunit G [Defluviitaleaceae bacterium]